MGLAVSSAILYWLDNEAIRMLPLVALYAIGGLFAFPVAALVTTWLSINRTAQVRFSVSIVALSICTLGFTALFFAINFQYTNGYYAIWNHGRYWPLHITVSGIAAVYQFLVMGARFFFPLGIVFLFPASFWLTRALR